MGFPKATNRGMILAVELRFQCHIRVRAAASMISNFPSGTVFKLGTSPTVGPSSNERSEALQLESSN